MRLAASSAPTRLPCAAACVCCQTRGGAEPFGDRARQSHSPRGRCGPEQYPGRGCCASWRSDAASHACCGRWSIDGSWNPGSSGCGSGGICGGVFAAASAARSDTVGRRMAHNAAAAAGVVAVSALQRRCQPQLGHVLQQMRVERQGDDAICKSSRGRSPLSQRTAHRVWSEPEECTGTRAVCRSGFCAAVYHLM